MAPLLRLLRLTIIPQPRLGDFIFSAISLLTERTSFSLYPKDTQGNFGDTVLYHPSTMPYA